jgi:hypothetical protein
MYKKGKTMWKTCSRSRGLGLIEVLVAVAVIAAIALLVSQFVVSQGKQQTNIRSSASCEARLSSILSKIKEMDNNAIVSNWMPQTNEMLPTVEEVRSRLRLDIVEGYDGATVGEFLDLADSISHTTYSAAESASAGLANNFQLISSATSMLASIYPAACATAMDATALANGQLKSLLQAELGGLDGISLQVERLNSAGASSCDVNWQPVPLNVNPSSNVNNADLVRLTIGATYIDETTSVERSCTANATFSPGSDLVAAPVQVTVTPIGLTAAPSGTFCGTGTATASFQVDINQGANPEAGVQYFCRLDYVRGSLLTLPNRYSGTGWFVCTMPEAAISNVETTLGVPASRLSVSAVSLPNPNAIRFTVGNAAEGSYKLHVKSIDVARNETSLVREIRIDLTRPQVNIPVANLPTFTTVAGFPANQYRFQCNNTHTPWVNPPTNGFTESVSVSDIVYAQGYWNSNAIGNPGFNCSSADVSIASPMSDGPKSARFAVCDECNTASGGDIANYYWFVDSTENLAPTAASLSSGQMTYDAGNNDGNPYVLTHLQMTNVGHTTSTSSFTYHIRNSYDATNNSLVNSSVSFPAQGAIGVCSDYGSYEYDAVDGCGRPAMAASPHWRGTYAGPGSAGPNPLYCPSFETSVGSPGSCSPMVDCPISTAGGYSGNRATQADCTYYPNRHRSCASPTCPTGYTLLVNPPAPHAAYHFKCSFCDGSTEIIKQPVELGATTITTIANGCPGCNEPPCFNYARCYALKRCGTDGPRNVSGAGGGGVSACGVGFSYLTCSGGGGSNPTDDYIEYLFLNQDPLPEPETLFPQMATRPPCSCSNGATNYPVCNLCSSGYTFDGSNCILSSCPVGYAGPPTCTACAPGYVLVGSNCVPGPNASCGADDGQSLPDSSQLDQLCSVGTLSGSISFVIGSGTWDWTCQEAATTANCSASLTCPANYTYNSTTGVCDYTGGGTPPPGGGGGGGCFIAGTSVLLENGDEIAIEDIKVGDRVTTYNEVTREVVSDEVVQVLHHKIALQHLFTFELEDGTSFTANDIHPIYLKAIDQYVDTSEIYNKWLSKETVMLYSADGNEVAIRNIIYSYEFVPVYNLHVKGQEANVWRDAPAGHNYFVNGILVHNAIQKR